MCQVWSIMRSLPRNHIQAIVHLSKHILITVISFIIYSLAYNTPVKRNTSCLIDCHFFPFSLGPLYTTTTTSTFPPLTNIKQKFLGTQRPEGWLANPNGWWSLSAVPLRMLFTHARSTPV